MRIAFLSPPFHGHARPLWQLACELSREPGFECAFLDCFGQALAYPGAGTVQVIRLETQFERELQQAQRTGAEQIDELAHHLSKLYVELLPSLIERLSHWQADVVISDHFFSFGPIVAGRLGLPYLIAYSSPDIFLMDRSAEGKTVAFELTITRKKVIGFREAIYKASGHEVSQYPLSPHGNLCFAPDQLRVWNPSAFTADDIHQGGATWKRFHSFLDDRHHPLLPINPASPPAQAQPNDAVLADYLADPGHCSVLISFGTVWLRQLGGAKIEAAFVALLRNLLIATDAPRFRILYSGDPRHLDAAADGLALRSELRRENFINQRHLVGFADLFVFHGGFNSFCEAMVARTPMLIFPKGFDQGRVADLAVRLGVGERVPFSMNTARLVTEKVRALSEHGAEGYRARLASNAAAFAAPTRVDLVARALAGVVQGHSAPALP